MTTETNDRIASWEERRKQFSGGSQANQSQEPQAQSNSWEEKRRQFLETSQQPQLSDAQMANLDIPTDEILAYHNAQKPQQQPEMGNPVVEAGKGLLLTGTKLANMVPAVADEAASFGAWAGQAFGGDGVYYPNPRLQLPDELQPHDKYAKLGAEVGPYLIPGIGQSRTALALSQLGNAGKLERAAVRGADMLAENVVGAIAQNSDRSNAGSLATDLGIGVAGSGIARAAAPLLTKAYNAVVNRGVESAVKQGAESSIPRTNNEIVNAAKTSSGRESLDAAFSEVSPAVDDAARLTGVDINTLTPAQRSGNAGLQDVEGVLSSVAGPVRDAQEKGLKEITDRLQADLKRLGSEGGTSSEKTSAIRSRVVGGLNRIDTQQQEAWKNLRNTTNPSAREKAANARGQLLADESLSRIDDSTVKKFFAESKKPMTFDQMKEWRGDLSDAISKAKRSGEDNKARKIILARDALTEDMRSMASKYGFLDDWEKANSLSKQFFSMRESARDAFGKSLDNDQLVKNLNSALRNAAENGLAPVHKIIRSLPEEERGVMLASALSRGVEKGSRGGESLGAGVKNIGEILTPQNVSAIRQYLPKEADLLSAYGELARNASAYLKKVEQTGRTATSLKELESGVSGVAGQILKASANRGLDLAIGGAAVATGGVGGVAIASGKYLLSRMIEKSIEKRSVKYVVEKALQEGVRAVRAGGSDAAIKAAEKRLMSNPNITKILKQELTPAEYQVIRSAGIISILTGMKNDEEGQ
ncbi:hypothetical protein [Providencia alcalifaciens]|uniref:hypothetical protein n=1 Tax=Providencia alcalifaciens TaxID=126385 RepID=UPI001CC72768|nr:hypothetical protein [Providencia alcalifaciens]CAG9416809.1 hypothetical protein NVI2019_PLFLNFOB_01446 [Providencia alcalifaciens]CAG9420181.1 hypothetical protein NVI2019_OHEONHNH_01875 [Providencia alcalifaciens]CAG9424199.1 hypothetical protein NVI2019_KOLGMIGM_02371 [Providencia alcalifaciens]CAG9425204.1 hypothetical protein NVI2019_OGMBKCAO_02371 [Providencia alcalifaciens]CAG9425498.1 hypothetical protein NVI2019_ANGEOOBF_02370 [Providencia alcalifaciens]